MERLEPEVLKMIADALYETVQCPVCLGLLQPPVTLCVRGHGLCPACKPLVPNCPTCREPFINTPSIVLHHLLEALPRSCQFKALGCTEVYLPGGKHENLCSYRTVDCKILECEWSGQCRKLESHVTSNHTEIALVLQPDSRSKIEVEWSHFDPDQDTFKYIPFVAYGQVFWEYIHMNSEVKKLCISFAHAANDESNLEYYAVICFKNGDFGYTYTIKVPLDNSNVFVDFFEEYCMTIPGNMLSRFMNDDSTLKYDVHIIKEDK